MRSAAQSLPSAERAERPERKGRLGDALWPQLSREQKARDAYREQERQRLLRNLRELNARLREERR